MPAQTVIKLRRDTDANWTSTNPTLAAGEAGFESDTGKLKIGDGSTAWTSLGYVSGGASVEVSDTPPSAPEANTLWWESDTGTLFIYYDNFWVEAVTGVVGPSGLDGADNIVTSATAPTNTDVLWIDTSEAGDAVLPLAGTTGQVLQKASNADYDTEWATKADIPLSTVTAAGDLIVANGSASVTNLPVGTDGQVLTLTSGAPAWEDAAGGGMTLISSTSLTGSGDITVTSIPATYKNLVVEMVDANSTVNDDKCQLFFKNGSTFLQGRYGARYYTSAGWGDRIISSSFFYFPSEEGLSTVGGTRQASGYCRVDNYAASQYKPIFSYGNSNGTNNSVQMTFGAINDTSAVDSVRVALASGSFNGGTLNIYGAD